jgi:uncharacterized protein YcbK (DUF882 family)
VPALPRLIGRLAIVLALAIASATASVPQPAEADGSTSACQSARRARRARARGGRARQRGNRSRRPRLTAAQRRQIVRWHARPSSSVLRAWQRLDPRPLVLMPLRGHERMILSPESAAGGFDTEDLELAQRALATRDGASHPIHPRLIELLYRAVRRFEAPYVYVISGYRAGRATSRHTQGRAIDFVLPGVSDRRLASYVRGLGFVGVGIYPVSGFVHLDVRSRSYFWSDSSGPDQPSRERAILGSQVARYDAAARRRGEESIAEVVTGGDDGAELEAAELEAQIEAVEEVQTATGEAGAVVTAGARP